MMTLDHVRALLGIDEDTIDDQTLILLGEIQEIDTHRCLSRVDVLLLAAAVADVLHTRGAGIVQVEDIRFDTSQGWRSVAAHLRGLAAEADDDGPSVVEFHPDGVHGPEAASW